MAVTYHVRPRVTALPPGEVLVAFWRKGRLPGAARDVRRLDAHVRRLSATDKEHEVHAVQLPFGSGSRTVVMIGLGRAPSLETFRRGVATAAQQAQGNGRRELVVVAPDLSEAGEQLGSACAEAVELGTYAFTRYQPALARQHRAHSIRRVVLYVPRAEVRAAEKGIRLGRIIAGATVRARDLVNEPASRVTPQALAEEAQQIARSSRGAVSVRVLDRRACEKRGLGAFLAVARGSSHEPVFIHLTYRPQVGKTRRGAAAPSAVALVGKGVTFDSGGLSLKPPAGMETMKIDMAGAAAVFGVFSALPALRIPLVVHGFVAACENMPSGSAMRPGDIVRSASGKTIEVRNTDAEGRLTLADAFTEAIALKPAVLIDLATLTGACVVSLGEDVAGLFSNNAALAQRFLSAAQRAGEQIWQLPLVPEYREQLKSAVADIKNISAKRWGDAILAALFLEEFVGRTPWLHLDIAGPSYAESQTTPVVPVGASGFGVRTLLRFLRDFSAAA